MQTASPCAAALTSLWTASKTSSSVASSARTRSKAKVRGSAAGGLVASAPASGTPPMVRRLLRGAGQPTASAAVEVPAAAVRGSTRTSSCDAPCTRRYPSLSSSASSPPSRGRRRPMTRTGPRRLCTASRHRWASPSAWRARARARSRSSWALWRSASTSSGVEVPASGAGAHGSRSRAARWGGAMGTGCGHRDRELGSRVMPLAATPEARKRRN
mmetsp:Transcript_65415/g.191890  ORF Transcript_65415/g.191890 Transcript_65415/m.191890 type:complete len:215 (+) Transcript_65415:1368-2012(+)